jgi:hypothetical protein
VKLKGVDRRLLKKWRQEQAEFGYCPHYHKTGRILSEVRFHKHQPRRDRWHVVNLATGQSHEFRRNGTPLRGSAGKLIGPLIERRKVKT